MNYKEVDKPVPKGNQVLIKIHATTVSTGDCNVRNFTFIPNSMIVIAKVMFGFGAITALYYLQDLGRIQAGQQLVVIGASGSIGTAGVQLARHFGLEVTGVCSGAYVDMVKSLGGDKVIDYTKQDFMQNGETYDLIFDVVGATTFPLCKNSLKCKGVFLPCIMGLTDVFRIMWTGIRGGKKLKGGVAIETAERMNIIKELAEAGTLRPIIDRSYPLEQVADAFKYVEQGHKTGNVVIAVTHRSS